MQTSNMQIQTNPRKVTSIGFVYLCGFAKFLMLVYRIWQTSLAWRQVCTIPFKINLPVCISPKQVNCEWNLHVYVSDWEGCKDTHVPCNDRHCMSKIKIFFSIKDSVNIGMSLILCVVCTLSLFNIYNAKKKNNDYLFVCLSNLSHKYVRNLISSNLQASVRKNLSINEQMQLEVSSLMFCFLFSSSELILVKRERWVACFQLAICL